MTVAGNSSNQVLGDRCAQGGRVFVRRPAWLGERWLQIAVALALGAVLYLLPNLICLCAIRLCKRRSGVASWHGIAGLAIAQTSQIFIVHAAARLVDGYANAAISLAFTIAPLFTIAAAFRSAVWARKIAFGTIEHRTPDHAHQGQALLSALGWRVRRVRLPRRGARARSSCNSRQVPQSRHQFGILDPCKSARRKGEAYAARNGGGRRGKIIRYWRSLHLCSAFSAGT